MAINVHTPPPRAGSGKPPIKNLAVKLILLSWVVAGLVGVLVTGLRKGGFLTISDVGALPALLPIQTKLRPLDACEIEYARRDKYGRRTRLEHLQITPCGESSARIVLPVADTWGKRGVGFELERESPAAPWKVFVEKNEVPFDELLGALNEFAPRIAAEYPRRKRAQDEAHSAFLKARERAATEAQEREKRAADSYPE